ncbi:hypothetical protein EDB83DRAFT_2319260 [Lactarius deliciosus]|nr:hypothetical protein EDB83DRAFT_2319260 [Lactarius deliciosus]
MMDREDLGRALYRKGGERRWGRSDSPPPERVGSCPRIVHIGYETYDVQSGVTVIGGDKCCRKRAIVRTILVENRQCGEVRLMVRLKNQSELTQTAAADGVNKAAGLLSAIFLSSSSALSRYIENKGAELSEKGLPPEHDFHSRGWELVIAYVNHDGEIVRADSAEYDRPLFLPLSCCAVSKPVVLFRWDIRVKAACYHEIQGGIVETIDYVKLREREEGSKKVFNSTEDRPVANGKMVTEKNEPA